MQKFLKSSKPIIILTVFLFAFFIFSSMVLAVDTGLDTTAGVMTNYPQELRTITNVNDFLSTRIGKIIGAVLAFVGVIFFVIIIYGGFMWMTAGGDEAKVTKAKDLITQAVIGLVIVLAAYAITAFVGEEITKAPA